MSEPPLASPRQCVRDSATQLTRLSLHGLLAGVRLLSFASKSGAVTPAGSMLSPGASFETTGR